MSSATVPPQARSARALLARLGCALVVVLALGPAPAAQAAPAAAVSGWVRVAQLSPDTRSVDATLTGLSGGDRVTLPDVAYGSASGYVSVPVGAYLMSIGPHDGAAGATPLTRVPVTVTSGSASTVALLGRNTSLRPLVLSDDLRGAPTGSARVRLVQASTRPAPVTITSADGETVAQRVAGGSVTGYAEVRAGSWTLTATGGGRTTHLTTRLGSGQVASLLVLDDGTRGLALRAIVESADVGVIPTGPVAAGGGFLAHLATARELAALLAAAAGVALLLVVLMWVPRRRRFRATAAAVLILLAGGVVAGRAASTGAAGPAVTRVAAPVREDVARIDTGRTAALQRPAVQLSTTAEPTRIVIPRIGVRSILERTGRGAGGALEPPQQPMEAAWYAGGTVPGQVGPAVIVGHLDSSDAAGVFARLHELRPGDRATVELSDGSQVRFVVTSTRTVPQDRFPAYQVYGPTPNRDLRLITCAGTWDAVRGAYSDDLIVSATEVP